MPDWHNVCVCLGEPLCARSKMVCLLQQEASWWLVEPGLVSTIYVLEMN
jgi:hypothetical protein